MKVLKNYIIITRRNGKQKVYTAEKYKWMRRIKTAAVIVFSLAVLILMCGAVIIDDHPLRPFQLVMLVGLGVAGIVGGVYMMSEDKDRK